MADRVSLWVLWVGVVGLALSDWMVGGSIAQDRGGANDAAVPTHAPPGADLTESLAQPVTIDGVRLALETSADGHYALEARNEGTEPKRLALSVECWDTVGSPMSRMGPMPRKVASVPVVLVLGAHETLRRPLELPAPSQAPVRADQAERAFGMGWIATRDVRITRTGTNGEAQAQGVAQLAARVPAGARAAPAPAVPGVKP